MATNCKWLTVPQGPFSQVLQYLDIENRIDVHDTCKAWKGMAIYFFKLQTEIDYRHARYVGIPPVTIVRLASLCPNLTAASIAAKTFTILPDRALSTLLLKCKALTSLALQQGHYALAERTSNAFVARTLLPGYAPLTSLKLSNIHHYRDEELALLVATCTKLQTLTFSNCHKLGNKTIEALVTHCPNLQKLHVDAYHAIHFYPEGDARNYQELGCILDCEKAEALQNRFKNGCKVTVFDGRITRCVVVN